MMKTKERLFSGCTVRIVCLSAVLAVSCVALIVAKTAIPALILPRITLCLLTALSLAALWLSDGVFGARSDGAVDVFLSVVLAAVALGAASWCTGLTTPAGMAVTAIGGGAVYAVCLIAFTGARARIGSARLRFPRAALAVFAVLAWLAAQGLAGFILR